MMFKGSATVLALMVFGECFGLLMVIIVANTYSAQDTGLLLFLQNNLFLFGTIGALGLGTSFHRYVPKYQHDKAHEQIRGLQRWAFGVAFVGLCLTAVGHTVFLQYVGDTELSLFLELLAGLAVVCWGGVTVARHMMRAMRLIFWSEFSYQVIRPVGGALLLSVGLLFGATSNFIVVALLVPLLLGLGHDIWRSSRLSDGLLGQADFEDRPKWAKSAWHFALFNLSRVVLQRLDLFAVTVVLGLEAAAIYGVVSRLSLLAMIAVDPIQSMLQPRVSHNHDQGNIEALNRDVIQGGIWIATAAVSVTAVFVVSAPFWLNLFGAAANGVQSIALLFLLLVGNVALAQSSVATALLLMMGQEIKLGRYNSLMIFLVYPPVLFGATYYGGLYGAALSTVFMRCMVSGGAVFLANGHTGILALPLPSSKNLKLAFGPVFGWIANRF